MSVYGFIVMTILLSLLIAIKQKIRGLRFWSSFFISLIAVGGVLATIWKILS